ncbi:YT521-B-like domain-containing protein [Aspergillus cavernicola]|uniref:YT521-B-like domain-containing protein n=1 Tax=Aspergillus cavernicola TaxID=176166 RepID=A0ABR4J3H8_9EURO
MDRGSTPPDRPRAAREEKGENRAPSEPGNLNDPGGPHAQSSLDTVFFRQTSRSENVQHYPEMHTYMTPAGSYGHLPPMLGMGNMASPSYPSGPTQFDQQTMQQQPFVPISPTAGLMYGIPQFPSFPVPHTTSNMIYNAPYHQVYMPYVHQQQQHQGTGLSEASGFQHLAPNASSASGGSVPNQMDAYGQSYFHNTYATIQRQQSRAPDFSSASPQPRRNSHSRTPKAHEDREKETRKRITIVDGSTPMKPSATPSADSTPHLSKSSTPKGPSRKPKQSGNALWVGNLTPGTNIVELKDHFSQDATKDLESVFLISRSNCAFVNYKTEEACLRALSRFHDTRLRGARLVCRVRRGLMPPRPHSEFTGLQDAPSTREAEELAKTTTTEDEGREGTYSTRAANRYFILKSLTVEDLGISWQSGIWATQTHNEESLNQAFENADNVYLIFSANKSGEYFGYARMMSTIKEDESLTFEMPPQPDHHSPNELDSPDVIPTPASSSAPTGRIINDVARGTIFWEADTSEDEDGNPRPQKSSSAYQAAADDQQQLPPPTAELQLIRKPFRIRWLSTERVPFHRTRGLRNPWNANREVKIARDATELEFSVGEKLVLLFHPESSG